MSDAAAAPDAKPVVVPKGNKPSPVVLLLCALNLGATGFVAFKVLKISHLAAGGAAEAHEAPAAVKPLVAFDPFVVNLNEPGSNRYLKTSFEFELNNEKAVEELNHNKRAIRDEVLRYLSGLGVNATIGADGKAKIQDDIVARVDKVLGGGRVSHLYFSDFVVQ